MKWPFDDPPTVAVIIDKRILRGAEIRTVAHDAEDGCWQFLTGDPSPPKDEDLSVVGLGTALRLDGTLGELADLPPGWLAWRPTKGSSWTRLPQGD